MRLELPNQTLERTGLGLRVMPWSFGFARVRTPVAQLSRYAAKFGLFGNVAVAGRQLPCQ